MVILDISTVFMDLYCFLLRNTPPPPSAAVHCHITSLCVQQPIPPSSPSTKRRPSGSFPYPSAASLQHPSLVSSTTAAFLHLLTFPVSVIPPILRHRTLLRSLSYPGGVFHHRSLRLPCAAYFGTEILHFIQNLDLLKTLKHYNLNL